MLLPSLSDRLSCDFLRNLLGKAGLTLFLNWKSTKRWWKSQSCLVRLMWSDLDRRWSSTPRKKGFAFYGAGFAVNRAVWSLSSCSLTRLLVTEFLREAPSLMMASFGSAPKMT